MSTHSLISPKEAADRLAIRELVDAYARCADRRDAQGLTWTLPYVAATHMLGNWSQHAAKVGSKLGSNLPVFRSPISGLNGAESTVRLKINSRMLYR